MLRSSSKGTLILRQKSASAEKVLAAFAEAMNPKKKPDKGKGVEKAKDAEKAKPKGKGKGKGKVPMRIQKRG